MDTRMDHKKTKAIVDELGWDGFIKYVSRYFPKQKLHSCSQDWFHNPKYVCKLRGSNGDITIGWHGYHEY